MEKQEKVINKIKGIGSTGSGTNLGVKNNDECYTSMNDILKELSYWGNLGKFKDKNVICPCDWDIVEGEEIYSIKITYKDNFSVTGNVVESVVYNLWNDATNSYIKIAVEEDQIDDFLKNKLTCNFIRTLAQNARKWGLKSITASGFNPATGKGIEFQNIDYSKYDICTTNPPFSLYTEFMETMLASGIDFIVLAPFMNRNTPNVGLPLMLGKAYIGTSGNSDAGYIAMNFTNPTATNRYHTKKVACDWITSFSEAQEERNRLLANNTTGVDYDLYKEEYVEMPNMTMKDGTHPIRVPADSIPDNYDGWMFGAVNIITKISFDKYEWYCTNCKGYFNKDDMKNSIFTHKADDKTMLVSKDGNRVFHGIVFRKKQK